MGLRVRRKFHSIPHTSDKRQGMLSVGFHFASKLRSIPPSSDKRQGTVVDHLTSVFHRYDHSCRQHENITDQSPIFLPSMLILTARCDPLLRSFFLSSNFLFCFSNRFIVFWGFLEKSIRSTAFCGRTT